jgi:N-acyl-D-aspartate/D-glutamate deacylase
MMVLLEGGLGGDALVVAEFPERKELEGLSISEIAAQQGGRSSTDVVIDLLEIGDPGMVVHSISPHDLENFMRQPYVSTSSDGGNPTFGESLPHPRYYGAFARKINEYVNRRKIIDLPFAIRAATSLPAEILGLSDRGQIRPGFVADLVVFDPTRFKDEATFEDPHQFASGLSFLFLAGELAVEQDRYTGLLAGRPLRQGIQKN